MSVTTRLRFEILKRDGFRCRYRGAPDVELHVDHVQPVALGGSDDPSNLVTACKDCNAGKSAIPLDDQHIHRYADIPKPAPLPVKHYAFATPTDEEIAQYGPPVIIPFEDLECFPNPKPISRWTALLDLVRRSDVGEPRTPGALSGAWGWSKGKVRRFLHEVEHHPNVVVTYE